MRARPAGPPPPPRPAPPTSKPTPERQRHAQGIEPPDLNGRAFRPGWLVATRLDALFTDKLIGQPAYAAALGFRRDYERLASALGSAMGGIGLTRASHDDRAMLSRLQATKRLRRIRDRIGAATYAVAVLVAVEDVSWTELARRLGCSDKTARHRGAEAIMRLADSGDRAESA